MIKIIPLNNTPILSRGLFILLMIGCMRVFAFSDSMTPSINNYFSVLKDDFKACAASSALRSRHIKRINARLVKTLKQHQPIFSILITTSKGKTITEIARGEKPVQTKKNVSKKVWYLQARNTLKEYDGVAREVNGRYYLFWSVPLFHKAPKGHVKFEGIVVAKIDLWDCFQKIAEPTQKPFCIRLNDLTLFTHSWENQRIYLEDSLVVPGAESISVRYQKSGVSAVASQGPESSSVISQKESSQKTLASIQVTEKKEPKSTVSKSNLLIVIGLIILIIIITVILIVQLIGKIKHLILMRSIDKQD